MSTGVIGLLLVLGMVSTGVSYQGFNPIEATTEQMGFRAVRPGNPDSTSDSLELKCTFDGPKTNMKYLYTLAIWQSEENEDEMSDKVAWINKFRPVNNLGESALSVEGSFQKTGVTRVEATFVSNSAGYCRTYWCLASGFDVEGYDSDYIREIKLDAEDGSNCIAKKIGELVAKVDQCSVDDTKVIATATLVENLTEKVNGLSALTKESQEHCEQIQTLSEKVDELSSKQENLEKSSKDLKALEEQLSGLSEKLDDQSKISKQNEAYVKSISQHMGTLGEALGKVLTIKTVEYDVSSIYKEHIYIASKTEPNFDLEKMNELCKESMGYLAEIDDEEERKFVADFVDSIGGNHIFGIGGTDVDNEGEFVYYNSKKPVPDELWAEGEPNNTWNNENCVQIASNGLNDIRCNRPTRYVCEIPIV